MVVVPDGWTLRSWLSRQEYRRQVIDQTLSPATRKAKDHAAKEVAELRAGIEADEHTKEQNAYAVWRSERMRLELYKRKRHEDRNEV